MVMVVVLYFRSYVKRAEAEMMRVTRSTGGQDCLAFLFFILNNRVCTLFFLLYYIPWITFFLTDKIVISNE